MQSSKRNEVIDKELCYKAVREYFKGSSCKGINYHPSGSGDILLHIPTIIQWCHEFYPDMFCNLTQFMMREVFPDIVETNDKNGHRSYRKISVEQLEEIIGEEK